MAVPRYSGRVPPTARQDCVWLNGADARFAQPARIMAANKAASLSLPAIISTYLPLSIASASSRARAASIGFSRSSVRRASSRRPSLT